MRRLKYQGFWDHEFGPDNGRGLLDFVNVGKTMSVDALRDVAGQGTPIIPHIGGFTAGDGPAIWRSRFEDKGVMLSRYKDHLLFSNLVDEPYGNWNIDASGLEQLIDIGKVVLGADFKFGYTFMQLTINSFDRKLPRNADWLGINFYPFRYDDNGAGSRTAFMDLFRFTVDNARRRYNGNLFIVGQGFYSTERERKYARPHPESPYWYREAMEEMDIELLLWYRWRNSHNYICNEDNAGLIARQRLLLNS